MDLREQVVQFRSLLQQHGLKVDDFELNVRGDAFRELLDGGDGSLEVRYRTTDVAIAYHYDGTAGWLGQLARDLRDGTFLRTV